MNTHDRTEGSPIRRVLLQWLCWNINRDAIEVWNLLSLGVYMHGCPKANLNSDEIFSGICGVVIGVDDIFSVG